MLWFSALTSWRIQTSPRAMSKIETVSRPSKENHGDTILYEIDMLDHCFNRLGEHWPTKGRDYYLYVEGFLLHYRNLIVFFGNQRELKAKDAWAAWTSRKLSNGELASIQNVHLCKKYHNPISRYLNHCSAIRAERDGGWKHVEMYNEIKPLLENFRKFFPSSPRPAPTEQMLDGESASIRSTARLSPSILLESELIALGLRKPSK